MTPAAEPAAGRRPRLARGQARVASLLAAGMAVFAARGYDAATMTEIAAAAGSAIGSLYQFFPTKQSLADALHARMSDELFARLDAIRTGGDRTAQAVAGDVLDVTAGFLRDHPAFNTLSDRRDVDRARRLASRQRIRRKVAALLEGSADRIEPERARSLAALILELMKSMVVFSSDEDPAVQHGAVALLRAMFADLLA